MSEAFACGNDLGTMFICSARDDNNGGIVYNSVRDCYREIPYVDEFEETFKTQKVSYMKDGNKLYVLGDDAYLQAGMVEFAQSQAGDSSEILKRPMKDGVLNPDSPKVSMLVLRQLMKSCIEKGVGPARPGEIMYFSVPANPVDSTINNTFHAKTAERYLNGLGYQAFPLSEAQAVVFSEDPRMTTPDGDKHFSGIGISFGAGMVNFCLAQSGIPIDEFSVCRSGDFIDSQAARMSGEPRTKVMRVKETSLDFDNIDEDDPVILALDVYYDEMINHVFHCFVDRFSKNKSKLEYPIEVVLSGGTARPPGFDKKVKKILSKMDLPFEVRGVRKAKDMLRTVAAGCYVKAKNAAMKAAKK